MSTPLRGVRSMKYVKYGSIKNIRGVAKPTPHRQLTDNQPTGDRQMRVKNLRQIRMVHRAKNLTDWDARLVYGCCLFDRPASNVELSYLTGIDRGEALPKVLVKLRELGLLDPNELKAIPTRIFPICKDTNRPATTWVGVMSDQCPFRTAEQNVVYWQAWGVGQPRGKRLARLMGVAPSTVKRTWKFFLKCDARSPPLNDLRPPEDLLHWWQPEDVW